MCGYSNVNVYAYIYACVCVFPSVVSAPHDCQVFSLRGFDLLRIWCSFNAFPLSEQDPLLGGESSQSGGVGASSSSGTDPDAPHDEDLENLGLGTEKRRIRSVDILSASQVGYPP